jgi:2-polyprenyl-3-methyl-5-hydroxy-6-metoxy-1,4-benzoquinol methylase
MDCGALAMEDYLAWMAKKGSSASVARQLAAESTVALKDLWEASTRDPQTFYQDPEVGEAYIRNLTQWHASGSINSWFETVATSLEVGQSVTDFGAGIGTYSLIAAEKGCLINACEVNEKLREYILWRGNRHGYPIYISETPWQDKQDVILCIDVVEHVADPVEFINTVADLLNPRGRLVLTHTFHKSEGMHPMHLGPEALPDFLAALGQRFRHIDLGWPAVLERR